MAIAAPTTCSRIGHQGNIIVSPSQRVTIVRLGVKKATSFRRCAAISRLPRHSRKSPTSVVTQVPVSRPCRFEAAADMAAARARLIRRKSIATCRAAKGGQDAVRRSGRRIFVDPGAGAKARLTTSVPTDRRRRARWRCRGHRRLPSAP